jgi:DNA-damage-inducible protein D
MRDNIVISWGNFEDLKQINQSLLGYSQWRRFEQAIARAVASCKASGNPPDHHFVGVGKPITGGKGAAQVVDDSGIH